MTLECVFSDRFLGTVLGLKLDTIHAMKCTKTMCLSMGIRQGLNGGYVGIHFTHRVKTD